MNAGAVSAGPPPADAGPPEPLSADAQLGRSFKAAMAAVRRLRGRETHRPGELSYAQYGLLFCLAESGPVLSARQLAVAADLSPATVTEMLEGMEQAGLVERERSAEDRRIVLTSLTDEGQRVVQQRHDRFRERWQTALAEFDEGELRTAAAILDRLKAIFDDYTSEPELSGS